jgi:hypothetical protein
MRECGRRGDRFPGSGPLIALTLTKMTE